MAGKLPTQTYHDIPKKTFDAEHIRRKLKVKHFEVSQKLSEAHPHAKRFLAQKGLELEKIREHSAKIVSAGALTGAFLLTSPSQLVLPSPDDVLKRIEVRKDEMGGESTSANTSLVDVLSAIIPQKPRPLTRNEEKILEQVFENVLKVRTRATLEGEHLNTTYGYIGAEQHLRRFPGDALSHHGSGDVIKEGIAPGLGAWGYFAPSRDKLTPDLENTERWYAVVQTLYLPDWARRQPYLRDWYKYRKVLIVNTQNGNAVVAAVADSGPAAWTGKHFGGSPEVMDHLGGNRYKKGPVILFFVDDPENKVPLGPVNYSL